MSGEEDSTVEDHPRTRSPGLDPWRFALPAHLAALTVAFLLLLRLNEGGWFFRDEWDFLVDRGGGEDDSGLFDPHNEHWSTVPILVYRVLFAIFGLRTYTPYVVALLLVHVAAVHLLWRVMRRSGADPWVSSAAAAILLVFGPGADNLLWAFQIGFLGSLVFGLAHILLIDHDGPFGRRDVLGWVVAVCGLMCSGIGVPMTAAAGLVALGRRGPLVMLQTVAVPAVVFALWWLLIGHTGLDPEGPAPPRPPLTSSLPLLPAYVWIGAREALEGIGRSAVGAIMLASAVVIGAILQTVRRRVPLPALACAAGALLMFVAAGLGRASYGVEQAASPRYVYLGAALLLPLIACAASEIGRLLPGLWIVPAIAGLIGAGAVLVELDRRAEAQVARDGFVRQTILAATEPTLIDGPIIGSHPDRRNAPDLELDELGTLVDAGELPPVEPPSPRALLQAAQGLQLRVTRGPAEDAAGGAVVAQVKGAAVVHRNGCLSWRASGSRPRILITYEEQAEVGFRLKPMGEVAISVTRDGITTRPHVIRNRIVTFAVPSAVATLRFESGHVLTLCGVEDDAGGMA